MNAFKIAAVILTALYLYEVFFNLCHLDLTEGGMIYKKQLVKLNVRKINIKKFCLFRLLVVRLNNSLFLLYGDVESHHDLIKKYTKHYSGGVSN